jgi:hypothetical protein
VGLRKYASVSPSAFGLQKGEKRIVVVRTGGAIVGELLCSDCKVPGRWWNVCMRYHWRRSWYRGTAAGA